MVRKASADARTDQFFSGQAKAARPTNALCAVFAGDWLELGCVTKLRRV